MGTDDLLRLIEQHGLQGHLYAADTQILGSCPLRDIDLLPTSLSASGRYRIADDV